MSTFRTSVAEYWLTQIDQSFRLYHYDAHSAIAEFADLFKSTRLAESVPANEKAIIVQERLRLACGPQRKESAALFDMTLIGRLRCVLRAHRRASADAQSCSTSI